jgi:hypothetical protein
MSEVIDVTEVDQNAKKDLIVEIKISDKNLSYRSDFTEAETIFWLEAVKDLIIKNTFSRAGMEEQ